MVRIICIIRMHSHIGIALSLPLLVLKILTDDIEDAFTLYHLAVEASPSNGTLDLHVVAGADNN